MKKIRQGTLTIIQVKLVFIIISKVKRKNFIIKKILFLLKIIYLNYFLKLALVFIFLKI